MVFFRTRLEFFFSKYPKIKSKGSATLVLQGPFHSLSAVRPQPQHPSSPFKRTPAGIVSSLNTVAEPLSVSSNGSDAGSSSSTSHANSGQVILPLQLTTTTTSDQTAASCGFHTGNLPAVADVRSPDVLHALKVSKCKIDMQQKNKSKKAFRRQLNSFCYVGLKHVKTNAL